MDNLSLPFKLGQLVYVRNIKDGLNVGVKRMKVKTYYRNPITGSILVVLLDIDHHLDKRDWCRLNSNREHRYNLNKVFKNREDAEVGRAYFDYEGEPLNKR